MAKKLNYWLEKPIYLYLFGFFFLVYRTAQYFPSFKWYVFALLFCIYYAINYSILFLAHKTKLKIYIHGILLIFWMSTLFYGMISQIFSELFYYRLIYFPLLLITAWTVFFFIRKKQSVSFTCLANRLINFFIITLTALTLISGINIFKKEKIHSSLISKSDTPLIQLKSKRDIIWILLDEYAAPASLRNQLKFHDELIDTLQKKGFYVFDSLPSRRNVTIQSINALFNLDDSIETSNNFFAAYYLKQSKWVYQLQQSGYSFVSLDFLDIYSTPKLSYLPFFPDSYFDQITSNTILSVTISKLGSKIENYNKEVVTKFQKIVLPTSVMPKFVWAHLLIPHPPFLKNAKGDLNKQPIYNVFDTSDKIAIKQYLDYLSYGNSVVLKMLNKVPDWKNKTIIISGDHGARMFSKSYSPYQFTTFAAIYYPKMDTSEFKQIKYLQQIPVHLH